MAITSAPTMDDARMVPIVLLLKSLLLLSKVDDSERGSEGQIGPPLTMTAIGSSDCMLTPTLVGTLSAASVKDGQTFP